MKSFRRHRLTDAREERQAALKKLLVREHADAVRARSLIRFRDCDRIKVLRDHSRTRARLFHLGDHAERGRAAIQRGGKPAEIIAQQCGLAEVIEPREQLRHFRALHFENLLEPRGNHHTDIFRGAATFQS
jgi:hypothetical protein